MATRLAPTDQLFLYARNFAARKHKPPQRTRRKAELAHKTSMQMALIGETDRHRNIAHGITTCDPTERAMHASAPQIVAWRKPHMLPECACEINRMQRRDRRQLGECRRLAFAVIEPFDHALQSMPRMLLVCVLCRRLGKQPRSGLLDRQW